MIGYFYANHFADKFLFERKIFKLTEMNQMQERSE